jgi:hypothetical protein
MPEPTATHAHEDTLAPQPLPTCLAPTGDQTNRHAKEWEHLPAAQLPQAGQPVVIDLGHVLWLVALSETRPLTRDSTLLMGAGRRITGPCGDVDWHGTYPIDPDDPNLEPEDAAALPTICDLLIAHLNAARSES